MPTSPLRKRKMNERDVSETSDSYVAHGQDSESQDYGTEDLKAEELHGVMDSFEHPDGTPKKERYRRQTMLAVSPDGLESERRSSGRLERQKAINSFFKVKKVNSASYTAEEPKKQGEQADDSFTSPQRDPQTPTKKPTDRLPPAAETFKTPQNIRKIEPHAILRRSSEKLPSNSRDTSFDSEQSRSRVFSVSGGSVSAQTSFTEPSISSQEAFKSHHENASLLTKSTSFTAREHWHIRDLPSGGLFAGDISPCLQQASSHVQYECTRIIRALNLSSNVLDGIEFKSLEEYDILWDKLRSLNANDTSFIVKSSPEAWEQARKGSANVCRTASLTFQDASKKCIFKLGLQPLRYERSCRFFRKFGVDRFLKVSLPSTRSEDVPQYLKGDTQTLQNRIQEWMTVPDKPFLGRLWSVFCVKAHKDRKSKGSASRQSSEPKGYDVFLFATEGWGIEPVSVMKLLDWFMPMNNNEHLPACKAFARIELGLSKTIATLEFNPRQVVEILDTEADGRPEDEAYNDASFSWSEANKLESKTVMNDGCARMSAAAAKQVWEQLKEPGPCASVIQARIGPWKGVWMVAPPLSGHEDDVWIEVTPSQTKFRRHGDDSYAALFDKHRLTFEVLQWSSRPTSNGLHADYLPILEDRGVPRSCIEELVKQMLDLEKEKFQQALDSPQTLYKWIEDNFNAPNEDEADETFRQATTELSEKIKGLLRAGFNFKDFRYLQRLVKSLATDRFRRQTAELKIPVPSSTSVYGVADPLGVLAPGEVHLGFSGPFGDGNEHLLHNMEALVGRHPSCRRSDIQKVSQEYLSYRDVTSRWICTVRTGGPLQQIVSTAYDCLYRRDRRSSVLAFANQPQVKMVFKLELRHLTDVVVFPSRGTVPLASKLQGGDYDGDKFWVCWEPALVKPFKNAPAPRSMTKPEDLGIHVDDTKLGSLVNYRDPRPLTSFLEKTLRFALQPALLGIVTNMHTNVCYARNCISSSSIDILADLHDRLVDTAKNGYSFDWVAWSHFQKTLKDIKPSEKRSPRYKLVNKKTLFDDEGKRIIKNQAFNTAHIVDHIVFETSWVHSQEIITGIEAINTKATASDHDVENVYTTVMASDNAHLHRSLTAAQKEIHKIAHIWWDRRINAYKNPHISAQIKSIKTREADYQASSAYSLISVLEEDRVALTSSGWFRKLGPEMPTHWDILKASLLFHMFRNDTKEQRGDNFVYLCAGEVICYIKAHAMAGHRPSVTVSSIFNQMRMRKVKVSLEYEAAMRGGSFYQSGEHSVQQAAGDSLEEATVPAPDQDEGHDTEIDEADEDGL